MPIQNTLDQGLSIDYFQPLAALVHSAQAQETTLDLDELQRLINYVYTQYGAAAIFSSNTNDNNKNIFHYLLSCETQATSSSLFQELFAMAKEQQLEYLILENNSYYSPVEHGIIKGQVENALSLFIIFYQENMQCTSIETVLEFFNTVDNIDYNGFYYGAIGNYAQFFKKFILLILSNFSLLESGGTYRFYEIVVCSVNHGFIDLSMESNGLPILHCLILLAIFQNSADSFSTLFSSINSKYEDQLTTLTRHGDNTLLFALTSISNVASLPLVDVLVNVTSNFPYCKNKHGSNLLHKLFRSNHTFIIPVILDKLMQLIPQEQFASLLQEIDSEGKTPISVAQRLKENKVTWINILELLREYQHIFRSSTDPRTKEAGSESRINPYNLPVAIHKRKVVLYEMAPPDHKRIKTNKSSDFAEKEVEALRDRDILLSSRIENLEKLLAQQRKNNENLSRENQKIKKAMEELTTSEMNGLKKQVEAVKTENNLLSKQLSDLRVLNQELQNAKTEANKQLDIQGYAYQLLEEQLATDINTTQEENSDLKNKKAELENKINQLKNNMAIHETIMTGYIHHLTNKLKQLSSEPQQLNTSTVTKRSDIQIRLTRTITNSEHSEEDSSSSEETQVEDILLKLNKGPQSPFKLFKNNPDQQQENASHNVKLHN